MICPYNEFKEMNCEKCGACMCLFDADVMKEVCACALARNGCAIPDKKIIVMPESKYGKLI